MDVDSNAVVRTIGIGFEPTGIAGGDEAVWVVGGYDHELSRIDTSDGRVRLHTRSASESDRFPKATSAAPPEWRSVLTEYGCRTESS